MKTTLIAVALLLAGCASPQMRADNATKQNEFASTVPHCSDQRQCEIMWSEARKWVLSTCGMKIQTMSDSFIETFNSIGSDTDLGCRVTKDPAGNGYEFTVAASCGNMFGCIPSAIDAQIAFNRQLNAAAGSPKTTALPGPQKLGAQFVAIPPALAANLKLAPGVGVMLTTITPNLPAGRAGLEAGDVITAFDATPITGNASLMQAVAAHKPGTSASVAIIKGGELRMVTVPM
jgi:hypothetical protein